MWRAPPPRSGRTAGSSRTGSVRAGTDVLRGDEPEPAPAKAAEHPTRVRGPETEDHWYFESLSTDGRRALLRQLDPLNRATFHVRIVDVDSGRTLEETALPELAKIPASTIRREAHRARRARVDARDAGVRPRHHQGLAPRRAASRSARAADSPRRRNGSAIAFDAGDWLYVADETGRVRRRLVEEAAYDPRFTPDGKYLFFRRITGTVDVFAKYELFVVPSDLSAPPRAIPGTAGMRDRFVAHPDGQTAFAVASLPRAGARGERERTCVVSLGLKPPFATKKLACLDGGEQLVESVISPKGKWAALSTKKQAQGRARRRAPRRMAAPRRLAVERQGHSRRARGTRPRASARSATPGFSSRAVRAGIVVTDVPAKKTQRDGSCRSTSVTAASSATTPISSTSPARPSTCST